MPSAAPPIPPANATASASGSNRNLIGDALYQWAREAHGVGHVFTQDELLASPVVGKKDVQILLDATKYLVNRRLFKLHDVKGQAGVAAYELVEEQVAANYQGLSSDEQMVYASIESAATSGIWTKTIKAKSGVHAKVLDRVYKSLEARMLIKSMKSVKYPQRKMYILHHLQPSEEATGGTWFNDGKLDIGMIQAVSQAIEAYCSLQSWQTIEDTDLDRDDDDDDRNRHREGLEINHNNKRKEPADGFHDMARAKAQKLNSDKRVDQKSKKVYRYEPLGPKYTHYPTLPQISADLREKHITAQPIPNNALQQLLDVMVFDDRLFRMQREARGDEAPDDPDSNRVYMYRCFTNPYDLGQLRNRKTKIDTSASRSARRAQEIEDIGWGGFSEVPCLDCPNFDICGDGGPVNPDSCEYLPIFVTKMQNADAELGDAWPSLPRGIRPRKVGAG